MNRLKQAMSAVLLTCVVAFPAGARELPRPFPVPQTVSPELRELIAKAPPPHWDTHPGTAQEWKTWADAFSKEAAKTLPGLREKLKVGVAKGELGGVPVFTFTPKDLPEANRDRVLLNLHGGGYVLGQGESGTQEAVLMAGIGKFRVIYADYRMAPEFPYPAAVDDAMTVYRELLKTKPAQKIGVFGTSTGGGLSLILGLRAKAEGLPLPAETRISPTRVWTTFSSAMTDGWGMPHGCMPGGMI